MLRAPPTNGESPMNSILLPHPQALRANGRLFEGRLSILPVAVSRTQDNPFRLRQLRASRAAQDGVASRAAHRAHLPGYPKRRVDLARFRRSCAAPASAPHPGTWPVARIRPAADSYMGCARQYASRSFRRDWTTERVVSKDRHVIWSVSLGHSPSILPRKLRLQSAQQYFSAGHRSCA